MRKNTEDQTLYRNYVRKWKFLIQEYELVKQKRHPKFRFAADFYRFYHDPPAGLLIATEPVVERRALRLGGVLREQRWERQ